MSSLNSDAYGGRGRSENGTLSATRARKAFASGVERTPPPDRHSIADNRPMGSGDPVSKANRVEAFAEFGGIWAPRRRRGNGAKMGNSYPRLRRKKGNQGNRHVKFHTISPGSREIGRCRMATPCRNLIAAKNSPNSGEYGRR